jgi:methionyl-tRNA formyltransferase
MKALFLGRAGCAHSRRAEDFLRSRFDQVQSVNRASELTDAKADALFAFRSRIVVRRQTLDAIPVCINFHPAPPERRGSGCVNAALAAGDESYGATCHYMIEEIDAGAIIEVRRFAISARDTVADILNRTYDYALCQFYDVAGAIAEERQLPVSTAQWSGPLGTLSDLNAMREISLSPEAVQHLERQVRATSFGRYQPYIVLHGRRFVLEGEAVSKVP